MIGIGITQNIKEAIHYYKEASSFNYQYAKNNLAIIYKNGIGTEKNIWYSIELLQEAIRQKNDSLSKYNLSHIYIYEDMNDKYDEAIKMLVSTSLKFPPSIKLLSILLIKIYKTITIEEIEKEVKKQENLNENEITEITKNVFECIKICNLANNDFYRYFYQKYHNFDFMYSIYVKKIPTFIIMNEAKNMNENDIDQRIKINDVFYEGFGIDL